MSTTEKIPIEIGQLSEPGDILLFEVTDDFIEELKLEERCDLFH